ncbi:MAG TPA: hypothetical protein PKO41_09605, partial [Dokdonella sp.]|nr:hypothetical protein [Dokdonella sp.]
SVVGPAPGIGEGAALADESVAPVADPMALPAERQPLAAESLMLDLVRAGGTRLVAVGERGQILLSDDGSTWRQAEVPLRSTLTAVSAVGNHVWAVGHDGAIVHSADGGESWKIQRRDPWALPTDGAEHDLRQGVPLLDVLFTDASNGIAIGAYSLMLTTSDGGRSWNGGRIDVVGEDSSVSAASSVGHSDDDGLDSDVFSAEELAIGQESDPHLNAIARTGSGAFVIVGERGAVFHSRDGARWERTQLPYDGSMFGVIGYDDERVLAFGLRGHVFESDDLGTNWREVDTGTELSLMGGAPLDGGGAVVVGANGTILRRSSVDAPLALSTHTAAGVIASVLPTAGGSLVIAGENGLDRFPNE